MLKVSHQLFTVLQCAECCSCFSTGELASVIPDNSCNVRGECCSTPSPTVSPTKNPTQRPTTDAPTTPQPTPNPTTPRPTPNPTTRPPTRSPTADLYTVTFQEMKGFASSYSSTSDLDNPTSAQYKAVDWLTRDKVENGLNYVGYALLQRYLLWLLYHATDGENWSNNAANGWRPENHGGAAVCNLSDLSCASSFVVSIILSNDGLDGTIPSELGHLTLLTNLEMSENSRLRGILPTNLRRLTNLRYLLLSNTGLVGTIPTELTQMTSLLEVWLFSTDLTGTVPSGFNNPTVFPDWSTISGSFYTDCFDGFGDISCSFCDKCYCDSCCGGFRCYQDQSGNVVF